jgi:hypothetical protein
MEYVRKRFVYIAGPIRAATEWDKIANIRRAEEVATVVAFCPHAHLMASQDAISDEEWIAGDLEIVARSDAIYLLPGWKDSDGSRDEHITAAQHNLKVLHNWEEFEVWINEERTP